MEASAAHPLERKRLAIIAEDSLIVETIQLALEHSRTLDLVTKPRSGAQSVSSICRLEPDLVLVDDLPHAPHALATVAALKAARPGLWVILLTIRLDVDWLEAAGEAGADAVISKAVRPASLVTILEEAISGNFVQFLPRARPAQPQRSAQPALSVGRSHLTTRELEILALLAAGQTNAQIAAELCVTEQTIKFHVANILRKLGVANRTQASHYAHIHGLVENPPTGVAATL
jgi:DNA-binding NarL/FixJ family response regulator